MGYCKQFPKSICVNVLLKSKKTVQILTPRKFGTAQMSFLAALVFAEKISGGARFCREKGQVWDTGFIIIIIDRN